MPSSCPSVSHGQALDQVYDPVPRLHVVPNATAPATYLPGDRQAYVFAAGRWDEGKNGQALDAAAALTAWPMLMAGALTGPNGARLDLQNAVPLGQLASAKLSAAPFRYEPFGLTVLEAARAGACLLLADIATFRGLWAAAAMFVDATDSAAWARAIAALAGNPTLRTALGERAREQAENVTFDSQRAAVLAACNASAQTHAAPMAEFF